MNPKIRSLSAGNIKMGYLDSDLTSKNQIKLRGKKCRPHQLFGVSLESPDSFKLKNTLIAKHGYNYALDQNSAADRYQYLSQKHFITIGHGAQFPTKKQKTKFLKKFEEAANNNKLAFHRKRGRLSDFVDKNSHMGNIYKIIGAERSEEARELRKFQIEKFLKSKDKKSNSVQNNKEIKNNSKDKYPTHQSMNKMLLAQKLKIEVTPYSKQKNFEKKYQINQDPSQQQQKIRPLTMLHSRKLASSKSIFRLSHQNFRPIFSNREFEINLPEWKVDNFKVNEIEWQKPTQEDWGRSTANSKMSNKRSLISTRDFSRVPNEL